MKICLINPSTIDENKNASPLSTRNKYFINPYNLAHIGLGYIAAVLRKNGYECDIFELPVHQYTIRELTERVLDGNYDCVGISCYYYNVFNTMRIIEKLRKKQTNQFIFLGGFLPTLSYDMLLKSKLFVDCCCIGEGEYTTLELVQALEKGEPWKQISGIAYLENGEVKVTKRRELIQDLDTLPFPIRPFVRTRKIAAITTSRGCYGRCNYCGIHEFMNLCEGAKYRRRQPEYIVEEIEYLVNNYQVRYITINDGVFHIASESGQKWFNKFEKLILEKNIQVSFLCDFRADEIARAPNIIERFKGIGLYNANVGVESFLQAHLDFYLKGTTVEENVKAIKILEVNEVNYTIGILIFNPITTVEDILEFCLATRKMNFYEKAYSVIRPLSIGSRVIATTGTQLYQYILENNLYKDNTYNYRFIDGRTEQCFDIINQWSSLVSEVFNFNYLVYLTQEHQMEKEDKELRYLFKELYFLDRDFIETTCHAKLRKSLECKETEAFLMEQWKPKLDKLKMELKIFEIELQHYY